MENTSLANNEQIDLETIERNARIKERNQIDSVVRAVESHVNTWFGLLLDHKKTYILRAKLAGRIVENDGIFSLPTPERPTETEESTASEQLDQQAALITSEDPALRNHAALINDCTRSNQGWLTDVDDEPIEPVALAFYGCKLRNGQRAMIDQYYLLTGNKVCIYIAYDELASIGIDSIPSPNGSQGCWKLLIPFNQDLDLFLQEVA